MDKTKNMGKYLEAEKEKRGDKLWENNGYQQSLKTNR